ncbi:MAG: type 4a pilus biogenesis protein PilO, partial [Steroidobacteraceae bacterium]
MTFVEQLQQLDFKDIGRWPFLFRALGVLIVLVFTTVLLVWYFVWGENGNRPQLLKARAEQQSLWATFDQKQRKAANLEAYRQQLAEIERTFGAMLRQLPGKTEVPSLLVDISQTGLAAGLQERLFQPGAETKKDFYAELPIKIQLTGGYHEFG